MSGLLDKANKAAEESEEVAVVDAVVEDRAPIGFADSNQIDMESDVDKRILIGLQVGGVIALLGSLFLLIQTGWLYATFMDYAIAILVMIFGWSMFNGSCLLYTSPSPRD